jgi:predicted nucleic acid-binding protein
MSDRWVINASPLIVFGKIGQLDLFIRLAEEIVVPQAVADEIARVLRMMQPGWQWKPKCCGWLMCKSQHQNWQRGI